MLNGSLAVWCDIASEKVAGLEPRLDLHFNMWLDLPGAASDALDIGIWLKESRQIQRLKIYVPAKVSPADVSDLSACLRDDRTLSAVFNSTLFVGNDCVKNDRTLGYKVKDAKDRITFSVVHLQEGGDYCVEPVTGDIGTILRFNERLFDAINEVGGTHYIRLRIKLTGELKYLFRDTSSPSDSVFLSGFHSTDIVEFRVNERRNFGATLRNMKMEFPRIDTIHYFLLRDFETELVQSHADFKKMRRLEPELWGGYLNNLGTTSPEKWIAYHWKADGDAGAGVEDFIALAFFSKPRYHLPVYLLTFLVLGAAGSAGQAAWAKSVGETFWNQAELIGVVLTLILLLYAWSSVNWRSLKRLIMKRICSCSLP